jgi:carboxyl-terminal processing protease
LFAALMMLLSTLPGRAEPFSSTPRLDQALIADVTGAALNFMLPRTLDVHSATELSLWSLRGLAEIDPRLSVEMTPQVLQLSLSGQLLVRRSVPPKNDTTGWSGAIAQLSRAAWDTSEAVRRAGTSGVLRALFNEMLSHLDPYSRYATPVEAAEERSRRDGRAGLGLDVVAGTTGFFVHDVIASSPASAAGIRPGERLLAIDGQALVSADLAMVAASMAGPESSTVSLTLRAPGRPPRTVVLRRTMLNPPTVFANRHGDILVLRITSFVRDTAEAMAREISHEMSVGHPPKGLVIDLRGNRGGLLRQAVAAAETLTVRGRIAVTIGRDPSASGDYIADGIDITHGLPVVILVDGGTASAAEVLAAALADLGRAVVVGSATLGKGLVQTILPLPDGGALLLTWSRVLAPRGWPLQALGVIPQVCTSLGDKTLKLSLSELAHGRQALTAGLSRSRAARVPVSPETILDIRNSCPASDGHPADLDAAFFLIKTPTAYMTALLRQ